MPKSFANIRSDFLAAVKATGFNLVERKSKTPLSPAWTELMESLSDKRTHIGLSRLARFASGSGIQPGEIDDAAIESFIAAVRRGSLHRKPNDLHRSVALIWNEVAKQPGLHLQIVVVPSFRAPAKRIDWTLLPDSFQTDLGAYLNWCAGSDPFDADARPRALSSRTLRLRRDQIHAAVTALLESGIKPAAVTSLRDLVSPDAVKRILRRRLEAESGRENAFNRDLAEVLVQIAREWAKVDAAVLAELKRLIGKMPMPASGLTEKNKRFLRQFDDPAALRHLFNLPARLWAEVKRDPKANFRTLAKAQAALAISLLSYMPLRLQNLTALTFGTHLFLRDEARTISTLELSASEVKNRTELAFDIPPHIAKMLIEYRDRIAPKIIGRRPERLFVNADGIPRLRENPKTPLAKRRDPDSTERMIRPGFLDIELRQNLIELARDGSAAHRLARRANALVLLDDGMSCEAIAKVLLLDDDTIRTWYRLYEEDGIEGLTNFSYEGSACQLSGEQQEKLKAWVATALPRTTRQVGAWIENEFGVVYEGRSGVIALLHRLGLEYHKPNVIPRKLDEEKQKAFIEGYEKLLNSLGDDEAVLFADAVHPTHAARPVGCWAPSQETLAIEQTSGRQRINIHGAIDLETGQTRMIEALTIDAASTIRLLQSIEALYPMLALIHVFLDNARYHHAKLVQEWLALPGRRIKLHFIPTYCPHLNPIERLWGLMHRNVTHNKCYATCAQFADATLSFLREKVPGNWADLCDSVTDNFRIINPKDFRVMT